MRLNAILKVAGFTLALTACTSAASCAAAASRNWITNPAIVQLDTSTDIFAVGDSHGDPERLAGVLAAAKLIDGAPSSPDKVKWIGGRSVLVVVGDLIDKWSSSIEVITLLRTLQNDAATQGGRVIITMGNHEAEFLADPLGKKTKETRFCSSGCHDCFPICSGSRSARAPWSTCSPAAGRRSRVRPT